MQALTFNDSETKSPDLIDANLAALRALFPELVTEGSKGVEVNLDVLKQLVGDQTITDAEEKYGLTWHGKRRARQLALTPSTGTLRPCPEQSVDWESTKHLMIEGDNLEVLKLLQKSYAGKVKLVYIDPPYNTGGDFVYPDTFQDSIKNYLEVTGQTGKDGKKLSSNTEASGRYHTDWLNMMYPRLKLARNLMSEEGVIFISIDDNEVHNLGKLCDEIFGEENFVSSIIWEKRYSPQNAVQWFSEAHDFILVYAKSKALWHPNLLERSDEMNARYKNIDGDPRGDWKSENATAQAGHGTASQFYELTAPNGRTFLPPNGRCWVYTKQRMEEMIADNRVWFGSAGNGAPSIKRFISDVKDGVACQTIWKYEEVGHNQEGKKEIKTLFPESIPFDTPKPTRLLRRILELATRKDEDHVVLDFFGGSGTTAHALLSQNTADGGNRRFIMVQLPEPTDSADYPTIANVTEERLRRAAKTIRVENPLFSGDLGFRVFKLASSNMRAWEPDDENMADTLQASIEHLKSDRTEHDILFELLLKLGLDLCVAIEAKMVTGSGSTAHEVHSIGGGSLLVCLSRSIPQADVEALAEFIVGWQKALQPAGESTLIFRDSAFFDDVAKTNLAAILNQNGLTNVRSL
ncbi:site-specific DNA-methyltransferase [Gemmatimonas sp.]|uniref:site-specific DNA-methyltransferase n=1 Tax=Gemmatimonas sp. TaxID=1962908 RepID=UPI00286E72A4|nr:site-specific DNA-methyltransferase [Gemmatimonas sp.]